MPARWARWLLQGLPRTKRALPLQRSVRRRNRLSSINYVLTLSAGKEPESLRAALDAGAPIVQFSWGLPAKATVSAIRQAGAKLGIQVTSAESARAALDVDADYLVCQGTEAGGHVQASRGLYEALPIVLRE